MRRLTDFEKDIVRKIEKASLMGCDFFILMQEYTDPHYLTWVNKDSLKDRELTVSTYKLKIPDDDPNTAREKYWHNIHTKVAEINNSFFNCLNLLKLLETNGLVYFNSHMNDVPDCFIPFIEENYVREKSIIRIVLKIDEDWVDTYNIVTTQNIKSSDFEIYIQNGFRTEDQVMNDDQKENNRISREINTKALKASNRNLKVAVAAVVVSTVISIASLGYSIWKDQNDDNKNDYFKKEVMIQIDQMSETIEVIRKDLNQPKLAPASPVQPATTK